jgi:hypothetical protein
MSKVAITGNASGTGTFTITSPNSNSDFTLTLPSASGTLATAETAGFPTGTKMMFVQTAAPTGWTKSTTHDNKALRVVSGTASTGGSVAFTTAFASQAVSGTVGSTTLSISQIPAHRHGLYGGDGGSYSGPNVQARGNRNFDVTNAMDNNGSSGSHNHSFTGTAVNLAVSYVDVIIATKD